MKTILLTLAIAFSCTIFAQGDLQFNQVVTKTGTSTATATTYTVPTGKIWKITGVFSGAYASNASFFGLNINGAKIVKVNHSNNGNGYVNNDPIWLNAGDTVAIYAGELGTGGIVAVNPDYAWTISIIEFNVVP
ncbi:hypothetical protein [Flavobacterium sp. W22_SRS_FP1]|uniref:hypothetical protein n=1 Tax=Flavobacterium sp. W22_SRS_FP1 TaxID=3240276 RepID=UPI003F91C9F3